MTQPNVTINELDGALGVLPSGAKYAAFVGVSSAGTVDTPAGYGSTRVVQTALGVGPLPEIVARYIETTGKPAVAVRTASTTASTVDGLVQTGVTGLTEISVHSGATSNDDYEILVRCNKGGTVGVAGVELQYSTDGGRNLSAATALGTAVTFTIPGTGGVQFDLTAATIVAGDYWTARAHAPQFSDSELGAALDTLGLTTLPIDQIFIAGELDASAFDAVETAVAALATKGMKVTWIGNFRVPNAGETEAEYKTAFDGIFASKSTTYGALGAGSAEVTSAISKRAHLRPATWAWGPAALSCSEEIDIADVDRGSLIGVSITDSLGNPKHHDESLNPGLDDSRAVTLRTWRDYAGVYCNRPRLFSASGSDFQLIPHRRVMNLAHDALRAYFGRRTSKPIRVNLTTGFILEEDAQEIESGAHAALRSVLLAKPKASGGGFARGRFVQLSRTDNLLSTKTLNAQARIIPLAYPEYVIVDLGFYNPALALVTV